MLKENRTLGGELRNQLVATVTEMLEKDDRIMVLDADLGKGLQSCQCSSRSCQLTPFSFSPYQSSSSSFFSFYSYSIIIHKLFIPFIFI